MKTTHETPAVLIDGEPVGNHTRQMADGSFAALNLGHVEVGGVVRVMTGQGAYELTRVSNEGGALEGWAEPMGGAALRLTIVEKRHPFLKPGAVLSEGDGLWVDPVKYQPNETERRTPGFSKTRDLGHVGVITYHAPNEVASEDSTPEASVSVASHS